MSAENRNWNALKGPRLGVMLHYDASTSDAGAVQWLAHDPRCKVSYNWLVLDNGSAVMIAPPTARAWHAGVCRSSDPTRLAYTDANSAFYGIAIAATDGQRVTPAQLATVVRLTRERFAAHGWPVTETWRIVGHSSEAWPRGRKHDPEGSNSSRPVLSVADVRAMVRAS